MEFTLLGNNIELNSNDGVVRGELTSTSSWSSPRVSLTSSLMSMSVGCVVIGCEDFGSRSTKKFYNKAKSWLLLVTAK